LTWDRFFRVLFEGKNRFKSEDIPNEKLISTMDDFKRMAGIKDGQRSYIGPQLVQLDVTNNCNNSCIACWSNSPLLEEMMIDQDEKNQTLSFEVIEKTLHEMHAMGTKEIYMAGGGDPSMHPCIFDIWALIKQLGMTLYVNTNFVKFATPEAVERILEIGVDHFTVSLWAGTPEVYLATHPNRSEEDFYRIKEALTQLNTSKNRTPYIKTYNVINSLNYRDFHNMLEMCVETGCESTEFTLVDTIPGKTECLLLDEEARSWLYEQCEAVLAESNGENMYKGKVLLFGFQRFMRRLSSADSNVGDHDKNIVEQFPCYIGWLFARIMPDGNVNSCLKSHRVPVGNVYHQNFKDIWSSSRQMIFRKKTMVCDKKDSFFSLIGNDAEATCGCYKSCDDIARNLYMHKRLTELNVIEKGWLNIYSTYLKNTNQEL
jgi:MoaA/NifB/PqqE/SkfB family radical SAM enzyme